MRNSPVDLRPQSALIRAMFLRVALLVLCLMGNGLFAFLLLRPASTARPVMTAPADAAGKTVFPQASTALTAPSAADAGMVTEMKPGDFSWSQFTVGDYAAYIRQLRAFGTPEPQVREIVIGAIDATYRPRRAALVPPPKKQDEDKFWKRRNYWGPQSQMTKEQNEQMRALRKEETDLIKSLFGPDVYTEMAKDSGNDTGINWQERMYGFLPKELREQVQDIEQRMNEETQVVYAQAQEDGDWQYQQADIRKIEKKYHDELAKILTPEQLEEWDLRHSQTANQLKNDLSAFDPNEDEFRALFDYQQTMQEINPPRDPDADPANLTPEERKANDEKRKAAEAELASLIGTNRVAEYKLEQDYAYRSLIDAGVEKDSVFKLDEMKKQAQAAANKIRKDQTLSPEQRTDALAAIRAETQNGINDLLGDKNAKRFLGQNGWWLNNIAPKPQPAPAQ